MEFDELKPPTASFEVRFGNTFLVWDRSGMIWSEVVARFPELKLRQPEPNKVVFGTTAQEEAQLSLPNGTVILSVALPDKNLERFRETSAAFVQIATPHQTYTGVLRDF